MDWSLDGVVQAILGAAVTIAGGGLALRKLSGAWASQGLENTHIQASNGIIIQLQTECKRLADQNEFLANNLNEFQKQNTVLQVQTQKLAVENEALRTENQALRGEITELKNDVQDLTKLVIGMQEKKAACQGCQHA